MSYTSIDDAIAELNPTEPDRFRRDVQDAVNSCCHCVLNGYNFLLTPNPRAVGYMFRDLEQLIVDMQTKTYAPWKKTLGLAGFKVVES